MQEVYGDFWEYPARYKFITTNSIINKRGELVMGRGIALQFKQRFPNGALLAARAVEERGNTVSYLMEHDSVKYYTFPVMHHWREVADILLIDQSAKVFPAGATTNPDSIFLLPRPGCGNGQLIWENVKPILEFLPDNVHIIERAANA